MPAGPILDSLPETQEVSRDLSVSRGSIGRNQSTRWRTGLVKVEVSPQCRAMLIAYAVIMLANEILGGVGRILVLV